MYIYILRNVLITVRFSFSTYVQETDVEEKEFQTDNVGKHQTEYQPDNHLAMRQCKQYINIMIGKKENNNRIRNDRLPRRPTARAPTPQLSYEIFPTSEYVCVCIYIYTYGVYIR